MIPDVPFEIWLKAFNYLPEKERTNLYPVNHAFFELSMDERYKSVQFHHRQTLIKNLRPLLNQDIARRVRTLSMWPDLMVLFHPKSSWFPFRELLWRSPEHEYDINNPYPITNMAEVVHGLTSVTTLKLHSNFCNHREFVASLPIVMAGWAAFGATLQSLTLGVSLEDCCHALSQRPVFPNLRHLSVEVKRSYLTTDGCAILCNVIAPFVNEHCSTLEAFELSSYSPFPATPFFLKLGHFRYLKALTLSYVFVSIKQSDTTGLQHFLELHSQSLTKLAIHFRTPNERYDMMATETEWFAQEFLYVDLPNLEFLDLDMKCFPYVRGTARYLQRYHDSLNTLILGSNVLSYNDVESIVNVFCKHNTLRRLDMVVETLSPSLLDLLAAKLGALEILRLRFARLKPEPVRDDPSSEGESGGDIDIAQCCEDMHRHAFSKWHLRHLEAYSIGYVDGLGQCRDAFARAMPGLDTLQIAVK